MSDHDLMGVQFLPAGGRVAVCRCGLELTGDDMGHARERHSLHAANHRAKTAAEVGLAEARAALERGKDK